MDSMLCGWILIKKFQMGHTWENPCENIHRVKPIGKGAVEGSGTHSQARQEQAGHAHFTLSRHGRRRVEIKHI